MRRDRRSRALRQELREAIIRSLFLPDGGISILLPDALAIPKLLELLILRADAYNDPSFEVVVEPDGGAGVVAHIAGSRALESLVRTELID